MVSEICNIQYEFLRYPYHILWNIQILQQLLTFFQFCLRRDMKFPLTLKGGLYGNYKDSLDSQEGILYSQTHLFLTYLFFCESATIIKTSTTDEWINLVVRYFNSCPCHFPNVLFFAYFMETVEKGESIIQVGKVLIIFVLTHSIPDYQNILYQPP